MLLGTYEHNLDDKSRLTIPSKLRNKLGQVVYLSKGFEGCIELRTAEAFEEWYSELSSHSNTDYNARLTIREILPNSLEVEFDNVGRIKMTSNILKIGNISKNVFILGVGNKIEIWDSEIYQHYISKNDDSKFVDVANKLGGAK